MSIETTTKCDELLEQYLTVKLSYPSEPDKIISNFKLDRSSNLKWLVSSDGVKIDGALVYQTQKIHRVDYTQIRYLTGNSASIVSELLTRLNSEAGLTGIIVDPIHISEVGTIGCLKLAGYKISGEQYGSEIVRLTTKCKPDSHLTSVRYRKSNAFEYTNTLIDMMTEYDALLFSNWNKLFGKKVFPTRLRSSNTYKSKQTYLARAIAQNSNWHCYLLFESDRAIGFIRAKVDKANHICYPELYLRPGSFARYSSAAYHLMLTMLHKSWVRYVGVHSLKTFGEMDETVRKFGKSISVNMFKM